MAAPVFLNKQSVPGGVITALYTVPALRRAVISTLVVQETAGGSGTTFQAYICPGGVNAGDASTAVALDLQISAKGRYGFTEGWTLNAGDVVRVAASTGSVTFTLFGEETDVPAS